MSRLFSMLVLSFALACSSGGGGGGTAGAAGTTGTGGASGIDCNSACADLMACCSLLSQQDCLVGCQQASGNPACVDCFSNTTCGTLDQCAIANCSVPASVCP